MKDQIKINYSDKEKPVKTVDLNLNGVECTLNFDEALWLYLNLTGALRHITLTGYTFKDPNGIIILPTAARIGEDEFTINGEESEIERDKKLSGLYGVESLDFIKKIRNIINN